MDFDLEFEKCDVKSVGPPVTTRDLPGRFYTSFVNVQVKIFSCKFEWKKSCRPCLGKINALSSTEVLISFIFPFHVRVRFTVITIISCLKVVPRWMLKTPSRMALR